MNTALWIVAGLAAAAFLLSSVMKLGRPAMIAEKADWAKGYSLGGIRGIGAAEAAGAVGLILPAVTGIATWLVPAAALGLVVVMIGAVKRHIELGEAPQVSIPAAVLGILALAVAIGCIWVAPFGG